MEINHYLKKFLVLSLKMLLFFERIHYNYIKETVETSLDHFLADTEFPYTVEEQKIGPGGMPGRHGGLFCL